MHAMSFLLFVFRGHLTRVVGGLPRNDSSVVIGVIFFARRQMRTYPAMTPQLPHAHLFPPRGSPSSSTPLGCPSRVPAGTWTRWRRSSPRSSAPRRHVHVLVFIAPVLYAGLLSSANMWDTVWKTGLFGGSVVGVGVRVRVYFLDKHQFRRSRSQCSLLLCLRVLGLPYVFHEWVTLERSRPAGGRH